MKAIPLTQGKVAIVDDADYADLSRHKWRYHSAGYAVRSIRKPKRAHLFMHRVIMGTPPELQVDHIDGDKLDNRRANLRNCSQAMNTCSRLKAGREGVSRFRGVSPSGYPNKKWIAQIGYKRNKFYLGAYRTEEEAARAYDKKAQELFGEFARLNFPQGAAQ